MCFNGASKKVLKNAYCPYSKFPVGAAILFKDGKVITGANIENVSFGVTNCAERSAIFYGASQGYRKGDILAIAVAGETEDYLPPCNICRQVMVEFCEPDTLVFLLTRSYPQTKDSCSLERSLGSKFG
ncbi:TPA: cytidine deaminase [Streptococcus pneumoniae]